MGVAVAVTGFWKGIGRTSLVVELGRVYAARGMRVLVVDADGKGDLGKVLGVAPSGRDYSIGLCDVLYSQISPDLVVESTAVPGVSWLGPGDYLAEVDGAFGDEVDELPKRAQWAMAALRERFDLILVDTPNNQALPGVFLATVSADLRLELIRKGTGDSCVLREAVFEFVKIRTELNPNVRLAGFLTVDPVPGNATSRSTLVSRAVKRLEHFIGRN
jgi:hypothetical protein